MAFFHVHSIFLFLVNAISSPRIRSYSRPRPANSLSLTDQKSIKPRKSRKPVRKTPSDLFTTVRIGCSTALSSSNISDHCLYSGVKMPTFLPRAAALPAFVTRSLVLPQRRPQHTALNLARACHSSTWPVCNVGSVISGIGQTALNDEGVVRFHVSRAGRYPPLHFGNLFHSLQR